MLFSTTVISKLDRIVLKNFFLLFANFVYVEHFPFCERQRTNYKSKYLKYWLDWFKMNILPWPWPFPNLNPIENVLSGFFLDVYEYSWQYDTVRQLKRAIKDDWAYISISYLILINLIILIPRRCIKAVKTKGRKITDLVCIQAANWFIIAGIYSRFWNFDF